MTSLRRVFQFLLLSLAAIAPLFSEPDKKTEPTPHAPTMTREETIAYLIKQRKNINNPPKTDSAESSSDKRQEKRDAILSIIPNDQIDLILKEAITVSTASLTQRSRREHYASNLRTRNFPEHEKLVIIANLQAIPELIDIIIRHGWCKDASLQILGAARTAEINPTAYIEALLVIDTPEARELLPELLLQGSTYTLAASYKRLFREKTSTHITRLPAGELPYLDMPAIVKNAWRSARFRFNDEPSFYAPIAACYGDRHALILMAKRLCFERNERDENEKKLLQTISSSLQNLVPMENQSPEAIARYVLENRNKLVFDEGSGIYSLPK